MMCYGSSKSISIVSLLYNLNAQYRKCIYDERTLYAKIHGIGYCQCTERVDKRREPAWDKVLLVMQMLKTRELVIWMDADMRIKNMLISPHAIFDMYPQKSVIFTPDTGNKGINCGVIFVRNTTYVHAYLRRIYQYEQFIHHPWWEQAAILHDRKIHAKEFNDNNIIVNHEYLNYIASAKVKREVPFFAFAKHTASGHTNSKYIIGSESCNVLTPLIMTRRSATTIIKDTVNNFRKKIRIN